MRADKYPKPFTKAWYEFLKGEVFESNPIPEVLHLIGAEQAMTAEHVQNVVILLNNNLDPINYTITRGLLGVGNSIKVIRGDAGECNLIAPPDTVWVPAPVGPDHEIATIQKSVTITRIANPLAAHIHAYFIEGDFV